MKTNETIKWQEEQALQRYQLIAPLLDESLDNAKRIQMREAVAEQNGLSPRTLYRYEAAYRKGGFPGLKPQDRESKRSPKLPENFDELLESRVSLLNKLRSSRLEWLETLLRVIYNSGGFLVPV